MHVAHPIPNCQNQPGAREVLGGTQGSKYMMMREGEHWICSNSKCRCEVLVLSAGTHEGTNPTCSCGFPMKKVYTSPKVRRISEDDARVLHEKFFSKVS